MMEASKIVEGLFDYFEKGGWVMTPLAIGTFVLWYALGYRYMLLQRGQSATVTELLSAYGRGQGQAPRGIVDTAAYLCVRAAQGVRENPRRLLDDACAVVERDLRRGRILIKGVVAAAPLTGLLGTVLGMIETFDSLADMSLYSASGGIAGGISQALFTTQMGLVVAVPGILIGRALDKRQTVLAGELARIKDLVSTGAAAQQSS